MHSEVWSWTVFGVVLAVFLALDLYSHRGEHGQSHRSAVVWTLIWVGLGLAFTVYIWFAMGGQQAQNYLAAFLIEKSLSLDNLFVFLIIFESLNIPTKYQRTPLSWGIFGALVFRAIFIFAGAAAIQRWHWVNYIFAALLAGAAVRTLVEDPTQEKENKVVVWLSRHIPVTHRLYGKKFLHRENGRLVATPMLVAIVALELTDILFAVDSVPAAFAVAQSPFVIYSSNAFAILGLRSLYIVMAGMLRRLRYLHYGLAAILFFAAAKIAASQWLHVPAPVSIGLIATIIGLSIWASLRQEKAGTAHH